MSAAAVLAPVGLLALGALLSWGLGLVRLGGRWVGVAAAWLSLTALIGGWASLGGQPVEVTPPFPTDPISVQLRLDGLSFALGFTLLVSAVLLLTFQRRSAAEVGAANLAVALGLLTVEAGSLVLTALGLGACVSLLIVILRQESQSPARSGWQAITAAAFILLWGAAAVEEASGGTTLYDAVPVNALQLQVWTLIVVPGVLCAGLLPWRSWVVEVWRRPRLEGAGLAVAILVPLGFLLLFRTYTLGGGSRSASEAWPYPWLHEVAAGWGALVALSAAWRARRAPDRRLRLGETLLPMSGGLALMGLALGTPLGLVAAVVSVLAGLLAAALGFLLPSAGRVTLLGLPLVMGLPPGLVFGARLLTAQAALASSAPGALWALAVAAVWVLGAAAMAGAVTLPSGGQRGSWTGALLTSAVMLAAGVGLGAVVEQVALPAAGEVMQIPDSAATGGLTGVYTASGNLAALDLGVPLLALLLVVALVTRPVASLPETVLVPAPPSPRLAPVLNLITRWTEWAGRTVDVIWTRIDAAAVERLLVKRTALVWVVATVALAIAVSR